MNGIVLSKENKTQEHLDLLSNDCQRKGTMSALNCFIAGTALGNIIQADWSNTEGQGKGVMFERNCLIEKHLQIIQYKVIIYEKV